MYKVVTAYHPTGPDTRDGKGTPFLRAEKGDILIDGRVVDDVWFEAKSAASEQSGRIPRDRVVSFCSSLGKTVNEVLGASDKGDEALARNNERQAAELCGSRENLAADIDVTAGESPRRREASNVHMTCDDENGVPTRKGVVDFPIKSLPKPPHGEERAISEEEGLKVSDEGYNSGSYYSGETNENSEPLLHDTPVLSKQDEAGYEVPQVTVEEILNTTTISNDSCGESSKKRKFKGLFRQKTFESSRPSVGGGDDSSDKYYNPPTDLRDNYFLPKTYFPIVRVLLSLVVALAASFTCLFLFLLSFQPLLSFVIAFVLFVIVFVVPLTLLHQGFLCVLALLLPSICSTRSKVAAILLLVVLLVNGPVIGIANQLNIASTCTCTTTSEESADTGTSTLTFPSVSINNPQSDMQRLDTAVHSPVHKQCTKLFARVDRKCVNMYEDFRHYCQQSATLRGTFDNELCAKERGDFCSNNATFAHSCCVYGQSWKGYYIAKRIREVLFCLLPVLVLFVFSDAYVYNKVYLTTKDHDNIYITQRLKELDCERKNRGLTDLILPLTRIEFQTYLLRGRSALSHAEKSNAFKWFGVLLLFGVLSMCFILLEKYIHAALLVSMAPSCRRFYETKTEVRYRLFIFITIGALFFVILVQSYVLRLRSIICDYFYKDMVDIRSKHLYYKILHDRHSFGRHVRRKIQLLAESKRLNRRMSCTNMIYHVLPGSLKWVCRKLTVSTCMICDSVTWWKTVACREGTCLAHYCYECYVDAGQVCLTCKIPSSPPPAHPNMKPHPVAV